jgi:hypothetical protein
MLSQPPEDAAGQISDRADHRASSPVALGAIREASRRSAGVTRKLGIN